MKFKRAIIIAIMLLTTCVGIFSGCGDKYDKITLELSQETLTLSLSNIEGEQDLKTSTITATLFNVSENMLKGLTYTQTNTEVVAIIFNSTQEQNVVEVSFTAISGGTTVVTISHEESGKSAEITINVIEKLTSLFTIKDGGAFAVVGETTTINTSKNVGFKPATTTEKGLVYSLASATEGITVSEDGEITVAANVNIESVDVVATSTENATLSTTIPVKIIKPILIDDVQIKSGGLNVNEIVLSSEEGADNTMDLEVQIATNENVVITSSFSIDNIAEIDAENEILFNISGLKIGTTILTFKVAIKNYEDYFVEKSITVFVKQKPNQVRINDTVSLKHSFEIFDWYSNSLGKKLNLKVNPVGTSDKNIRIIVPEEVKYLLEFSIYDNDQKTVVDIDEFLFNGEGEDVYVLNAANSALVEQLKNRLLGGEEIDGIKLINNNLVVDVQFYAYGCEEFSTTKIYANCEFILKKGIKNINVNNLTDNTMFVKVGEITPLDISVEPIDSLLTDLQASVQQEDIVEIIKTQNGISLKGLKNGNTKITIFSDSGATTAAFDLVCFTQALNFGVLAPTAEEDGNVYQSDYINTTGENTVKTLNSIIIARGAGVQLSCSLLPAGASVVNVGYSSSNNAVASVNSVGYVVGRGVGTCSITVSLLTYKLIDGVLEQETLEKNFAITIINPLKNFAFLNKSISVYNSKGLGYYGLTQKLNCAKIPLLIDSKTATSVDNGAIFSNLRLALNNNFNGELSAELVEDDSGFAIKIISNIVSTNLKQDLYLTLTATMQDYSRYFIQTCQIVIKAPVKVEEISITNADNNNEIYLEGRDGLNEYSNTKNYEEGEYKNTFDIKTNLLPSNATNQKVKYIYYGTNDNKDVCYIQEDGTIIPFRAGRAVFRIIPEDAFIADFNGTNFSESLERGYRYSEITVVIADGTQSNPYLIKNAEQLQNINNALDKYYVLTNDINLTGYSDFVSIASKTGQKFVGGLSGKYNGVTYSILGLQVNNSNFNSGLFHSNHGTIDNLNLDVTSIDLSNDEIIFGCLVSENYGSISNCSVKILSTNIHGECENLIFGGMVGLNAGSIIGNFSYFENAKSTTTVSGIINIVALSNGTSCIGGVVGENSGNIGLIKSEVLITANNMSNIGGVVGRENGGSIEKAYYSANVLYGKENVGGIAGVLTNGGTINNCVVEIFSATNIAIFKANNNLGGLIGCSVDTGENLNIINFCFVRNYGDGKNILNIETTNLTEINVGGLIGFAESTLVNKSYANIKTSFAVENQNLNVGGIIGNALNCELQNVYTQGEFIFEYENGGHIYAGGIIGLLSDVSINFSYSIMSFVNNTEHSILFNGISPQAVGNYNYYEAKLNNQNGFGNSKTQIEMQKQSTYESWNFVSTWDLANGKNLNYPYLLQQNSEALLTEIPTSISLTLKSEIGIVLNENNLNPDDSNTIAVTGNKLILPYIKNASYALDNLVELKYVPIDSQHKITIESSNPSVISVDDLNKLSLKQTGYAVITIYSSYSKSVYCSFEVYVSDMFTDFDIKNAQGISLTENNIINIKKNGTENIYAALFNSGKEIFSNTKFGIYYASNNINDIKIGNMQLNNLFAYSGTNVLQSENTITENTQVEIKAIPYFKVLFDNVEYIVYVKSETINFIANIYLGVDDIYLSETENAISLKNQLTFSLYVKSDLTDEEIIINKELLVDDSYISVVENSNNDFTEILQIDKTILDNEYVKYDYKLFVREEFLQYAGEGINLFNNKQVIKFNFYQNLSENKITTYTLTLLPQKVLKIDINHYPAGEVQNFGGTVSYYPQELPDNRINPGKQGILKLNVYPNFSNFDYLEITSSLDEKSNRVYFQQVVFDEISQSYIALHPAYSSTTYGINLKPVSYSSGVFDGSIFVKTLIVSKVEKGTSYDIKVTAYKDETVQYASEVLKLFAENLPGITLLYGNSTKGYIAKNTTTSALNFEITDYEGAEGLNLIATVKQGDNVLNGLASISRIGETNYCNLIVGDAPIGSKIYISAQISRTINGLRETSASTVVLTVVDFLINSVNVDGSEINSNNNNFGTLQLNLGSHYPLKANLETINSVEAQNKIDAFSKKISNEILNWLYVRSLNSITGITVTENLVLNQIYNNFAVVPTESGDYNYIIQAKKVSENSHLQLVVKYGYTENGEIAYYKNSKYYNLENKIVSVVDTYELTFTFNLKIVAISELTNPIPVSTADEFIGMEENLDYILMNDIVLGSEAEPYTAISTKISSFDGNGHCICINYLNTFVEGSEGKYGLFSIIDSSTIISNLTVCYSSNDVILPDDKDAFYFGGITGENNGVIVNCEIISNDNKLLISQSSYNNSTFIGGLVGINNGYITNSRFGDINDGSIFKFIAPVNVAGFVCQNNGKITSCYVGGNINIINTSTETGGTTTAGFVCGNAGSILYCFVEGYIGNSVILGNGLEGGKVQSGGNVAGFVYNNSGKISDCYTLINLTTHSGRIAGFAYYNKTNAKIINSYSASTFVVSESNMYFNGNNEFNEIQANKKDIIDCYYFVEESSMINKDEFATAVTPAEFGREDSFGSLFVGNGGNWRMGVYWQQNNKNITNISNENLIIPQTGVTGIRPYLVTARSKAISNREQVDGDESIFPYWYRYSINLGSELNPIIVSSSEEFIFYLTNSAHLINGVNYNHIRLAKDIDLSEVSDVDLNKLQNVIFAGKIDGNGMTISNLRVIATDGENELNSFGMFKQIGLDFMQENINGVFVEKFDNNIPDISKRTIIKNLEIEIAEVSATEVTSVGVLAGEIINSVVINVKLNGEGIVVEGKNMVGALAGRVSGDSQILNISSNLSVRAMNESAISNEIDVYEEVLTRNITQTNSGTNYKTNSDNKYSFAGGIVGVIDIYQMDFSKLENGLFVVNRKLEDLTITTNRIEFTSCNVASIKVEGSVEILGSISGGVVGYIGSGTTLNNGAFELKKQISVNENQKIIGKYAAGGLIGASKGYIYKSKVAYQNAVQQQIDDEIGYYGTTLFFDEEVNPEYIGGLVGIQIEGTIADCYCRANVINRNASYSGGLVGKMFYKYSNINKRTLYESSKIISSYTTANVLVKKYKPATQVGETDILAGKSGGVIGYIDISSVNEDTEFTSFFAILYGVVSANNWQLDNEDINNTGAIIGKQNNQGETVNIDSILASCMYTSCLLNDDTNLKLVAGGNISNTTNSAKYEAYLNHRNNLSFPTTLSTFFNFDNNIWNLNEYSMPIINTNYLSKTLIRTENDLKNMLPNGYYILVDDIYLSDYWKPLNINFSGVLTSLKTEDSTSENPEYFTIYNFNLDSGKDGVRTISVDNNVSSGLFAESNGAIFMNFNIVVGSNTSKSGVIYEELADCKGVNVLKENNNKIYNAGVLAGYAKTTTVLNVKINFKEFLQTQGEGEAQTETLLPNFTSDYDNIGGFFGYAESCQMQTNCVVEDLKINCVSNESNNIRNIGGIAGVFSSSVIENTQQGASKTALGVQLKTKYSEYDFITIDIKSIKLNVGAMFGKLDYATYNTLNCSVFEESIININVKNSQPSSDSYIGGYIGIATNFDFYGNSKEINNINISVQTDGVDNNSNIWLGGIIAKANNCEVESISYSGILKTEEEKMVCGTMFSGAIFGEITSSTIKNIGANINMNFVATNATVGGLFGLANGSEILACGVSGSVDLTTKGAINTYYGNVAGIIENSNIKKVFGNVKAKLKISNLASIGGFSGKILKSILNNCHVIGEIKLDYNGSNLILGGFVGNISLTTFEEELTYTATMIKSNSINSQNVGPFAGVSSETNYNTNTKYLYEFVGAVQRSGEFANAQCQENCLNDLAINYNENENCANALQITQIGSFYNPYIIDSLSEEPNAINSLNDISAQGYYLLKSNISTTTTINLSNIILNGNSKKIILKENSELTNIPFSDLNENSALLNLGIMYQNNKINLSNNIGFMVGQNNGYINQCFVVGKISVNSDEDIITNVSAFAKINEGYIYSSATSVVVKMEDGKNNVYGFVDENKKSGIIFNSFTTAVMGVNIKNVALTKSSGFVSLNSGKIMNAYSGCVLNIGEEKYSIFKENNGIIQDVQHDSNTVCVSDASSSKITNSALKTPLISNSQINYNYGYPLLEQFDDNKEFFATGNGEEINPYQVQSSTRFDMLNTCDNAYFIQVCDFDLSTRENYYIESVGQFNYNGNNFAIHNLIQNNIEFGGLFKSTANSVISNLGLIGVNITIKNGEYAGAFVSRLQGEIINCYAKGSLQYSKVNGTKSIGGLVGSANNSNINGCYSEMNLIATYKDTQTSEINVGGIAGKIKNSLLTKLIASGSIKDYKKVVSTNNIGGIVGKIEPGLSSIKNIYVLTSLLVSSEVNASSDFAVDLGTTTINNVVCVNDYTLSQNASALFANNTQIKSFDECINTALEGFSAQTTGLAYITSITDKNCFSNEGKLNPQIINDEESLNKFRSGEYKFARLTNDIVLSASDLDSLPQITENSGILGGGHSIEINGTNQALFNNINNIFVSNITINNAVLVNENCSNIIVDRVQINGASLKEQGCFGKTISDSFIKNLKINNSTLTIENGGASGFVCEELSNSYMGNSIISNNTILTKLYDTDYNGNYASLTFKVGGISNKGYNVVFDNNSITFGTSDNPLTASMEYFAGFLVETKATNEDMTFVDVYGINKINIFSRYHIIRQNARIAGLVAIVNNNTLLNVLGETTGQINHTDNSSKNIDNKYFVGGFAAENYGRIKNGTNGISINVKIATSNTNIFDYNYLYETYFFKKYNGNYNFEECETGYIFEKEDILLKASNGNNYYGYFNEENQKYYKIYNGETYFDEIIFSQVDASKEITLYEKIPNIIENMEYGTELPEGCEWVCKKTPKVDELGYFEITSTGFVLENEKISAPEGQEGWYYTDSELTYVNGKPIVALYSGIKITPNLSGVFTERLNSGDELTNRETVSFKKKNIFGNWTNNIYNSMLSKPSSRRTTSYVGGICGYSYNNSEIEGTINNINASITCINLSSIDVPTGTVEQYNPESKHGYVSGISDIKVFVGGVAGFVQQETYTTNPILVNNNANNAKIVAQGGKRYFEFNQYAVFGTYSDLIYPDNVFALTKTEIHGVAKINSLAYAGAVFGGNLSGAVDKDANCRSVFNLARIIEYKESGFLGITYYDYYITWSLSIKGGG